MVLWQYYYHAYSILCSLIYLFYHIFPLVDIKIICCSCQVKHGAYMIKCEDLWRTEYITCQDYLTFSSAEQHRGSSCWLSYSKWVALHFLGSLSLQMQPDICDCCRVSDKTKVSCRPWLKSALSIIYFTAWPAHNRIQTCALNCSEVSLSEEKKKDLTGSDLQVFIFSSHIIKPSIDPREIVIAPGCL